MAAAEMRQRHPVVVQSIAAWVAGVTVGCRCSRLRASRLSASSASTTVLAAREEIAGNLLVCNDQTEAEQYRASEAMRSSAEAVLGATAEVGPLKSVQQQTFSTMSEICTCLPSASLLHRCLTMPLMGIRYRGAVERLSLGPADRWIPGCNPDVKQLARPGSSPHFEPRSCCGRCSIQC